MGSHSGFGRNCYNLFTCKMKGVGQTTYKVPYCSRIRRERGKDDARF